MDDFSQQIYSGKFVCNSLRLEKLRTDGVLGQEEVRRLSQLPTALEPMREEELWWCDRSQLAWPWPSSLSSITQASHLLIQEPDVSGQTPVVMWHMWVAIYLVGKGYISASLFLELLIINWMLVSFRPNSKNSVEDLLKTPWNWACGYLKNNLRVSFFVFWHCFH